MDGWVIDVFLFLEQLKLEEERAAIRIPEEKRSYGSFHFRAAEAWEKNMQKLDYIIESSAGT